MAKTIMYIAGAVFIVLGLLGFVNDPILGIFDVDTMHNIVHLASGILALIFASQGESQARMFALVLGIVYALVTVLGFMTGEGKILGLVSVNGADNYLHLLLTVVFLFVGLKKPAMNTNPSM
jgi:hypothetical protein